VTRGSRSGSTRCWRDEDPRRQVGDLRVALPVPARDGSWVVDGWAATRLEPGAVPCDDVDVTLAAGRVLHARLDSAVRERPPGLEPAVPATGDDGLGPDQLVHAELGGNVLLDADGAPLVVGFRPAWAPVLWAEALAVLDLVVRLGADSALLDGWAHGRRRRALASAAAHRVATDPEPQPYDDVLAEVASR
jgi:hypothetical protein